MRIRQPFSPVPAQTQAPWHNAAACALLLAIALCGYGCAETAEHGNGNGAGTADSSASRTDSARIITLGGTVTETAFALGLGPAIVAVDNSSVYPDSATTLPQVGYQRTLSAENVLALNPTLILATEDAGPPAAIEQLRNSGVQIIILPAERSVEGATRTLQGIAKALGAPIHGERLLDTLERNLAETRTYLAGVADTPRILFIYARGQGAMQVSGTGTSADVMIGLAGGTNAVTGYSGYKPITAEAVIAARPDIILLPQGSLGILGGVEDILKAPGIAQTPAGKAKRIIAMDDLYLLGMGPRMGKAALQLARNIHQGAGAGSGSGGMR